MTPTALPLRDSNVARLSADVHDVLTIGSGINGAASTAALLEAGLRTTTPFDEEIEWTWFYLWHHEGRRARHGASMMAPDYTHWHGMFEVAERFYMALIPQAREIVEQDGGARGRAVAAVIDEILARPEHVWFEEGAEGEAERIRQEMERRYGQGAPPR